MSKHLNDEVIGGTVTLVKLRNPFNLKEFDVEAINWSATKTFAEYIPKVYEVKSVSDGEHQTVEVEFVASLNGKIILSDKWDSTYLLDGDHIIMCPIIGKDGKSIFKIVALIAISVFAPQVGASLAQSMGGLGVVGAGGFFASTAALGSFLGTVVSFVGSQLVNSLFSNKPGANDANRGGDSLAASPSYGYDGPKNISADGVPVPVVYGTYRTGGNVIDAYTENVGNSQYLYILYAISEGTISGISNIVVNDQLAANYKDISIETRNGSPNQAIIGWFGNTIVSHSIGLKIITSPLTYNTASIVDKIRFDIHFPNGLFSLDTEDGTLLNKSVELVIEYRKVGDTVWQKVSDNSVIDYYITTYNINGLVYTYLPSGYTLGIPQATLAAAGTSGVNLGGVTGIGQLTSSKDVIYKAVTAFFGGTSYVAVGATIKTPVYKNVIGITAASRTAIRRSYTTPLLSQGLYETRYSRVSIESTALSDSDQVYLSEINEVIMDDVQYNNTALAAVRVLMSDQLSGMPKITFLVSGVKVRVYREGAWFVETSHNPAWIFLDILTNTRYGGGLPDSRFDMEAIKDWANHCETKYLTFDGVFDVTLTMWDTLQYILRCGHAQILMIGTIITVAIERVTAATQMFSVANMIENTFQINWLPMADRANEIDVTYFDALDGYKQRMVKVIDQSAVTNGLPIKVASITIFGVITERRAYNEGLMQLAMNKYIVQTVTFESTIEAIACTVGDVIYVQHDMPQWGFGGRTMSGSTESVVNLDRPVDMILGSQYKLLCTFDFVQRASGSVSNILGTSLYLTGYDGSTNVRRILVAGKDLEVLSVFNAGGGIFGVVVYSVAGLAIGNTYTLQDTDVLEERDVVVPQTGEFTTLTVTAAFSKVPPEYTHFMFGQTNKVKKPFRVRSVTGSGEYSRQIVAIEYNESVYNSDSTTILPTKNYSELDSDVVISGATENLYRVGSGFGVKLTVSYAPKSMGSYKTSNVFVSRNGGLFVKEGSHPSEVTITVSDKEVIVFRVVAVNTIGITISASSAPTLTHIVVGKVAPPSNVANFSASANQSGIELKWDKVIDIDAAYYEIREGSVWATGAKIITGHLSTTFIDTKAGVGIRQYCIKAVDTSGIYSEVATVASVTILKPTTPNVSSFIEGAGYKLAWTSSTSAFGIDHYEVREGTTWNTGVHVVTVSALSYKNIVDFSGTSNFLVAAFDTAGNVSDAGSASVVIVKATAPTLTAQTIDNNILLYWNDTSGTLPIKTFELRKGAVFATAVIIGTKLGLFTSLFETIAGTFTYWVVPIDTAGNYGTESGVSTTMSQPPDYILKGDINSSLGGSLLNAAKSSRGVVMPINTAEQYQSHFTTNAWTSPQEQITSGNTLWIQPSLATGYYEEIIDYGAVLPACKVTITPTIESNLGLPTFTNTISLSPDGSTWVDYVGILEVFSTNFRYIKVRIAVNSSGGNDICTLMGLNVKLDIKLKNDAGSIVATSTDNSAAISGAAIGGTTVLFSTPFSSVSSIILTPQGTTSPTIAIYDFIGDTTNPVGFKIYLYNSAGARVSGTVSWSSKGY